MVGLRVYCRRWPDGLSLPAHMTTTGQVFLLSKLAKAPERRSRGGAVRPTSALTGPPPTNIDFRNDAIGGSASNALFK